jgi:uncharacterized membrane protein
MVQLTWVALAIGVAYYILQIGRFTLMSHEKMETASSDLAEFDNLFFNALHGHPFRSPAIEAELSNWSALKVHTEFLLYLLLPFYAIQPGPQSLLIIQTVIVGLTAIPIFCFAARRIGKVGGLAFALGFLLMPAVEEPNFYDFHFTAIGMLSVATTLALLDSYLFGKRTRLKLAFTLMAFACSLLSREDVSFGLVILGGVVAFGANELRLGLALATTAALWFVGVKFVLMPHFGTMWFSGIYEDLKAPGSSGFGGVVLTLLTNPGFVVKRLLSVERLLFLAHLTVPLLFLWLRKPWLLLAALPGIPFTLLATNRAPLYDISFQYVYHWIPYVFAASVIGLEQLGTEPSRRYAALVAMGAATVAVGFHCGALLGAPSVVGGDSTRRLAISRHESDRTDQLESMARNIPQSASVAATEQEGPHVSTRLIFYSLKFGPGHHPDYVLLGPNLRDDEAASVLQLLDSDSYDVWMERSGFTLLRHGVESQPVDTLRRRLKKITTSAGNSGE